MIGLPTRLLIAERALEHLEGQDPAAATLLKDNRSWFMLGALGPALGDFVPHQPPEGSPTAQGRTQYYGIWRQMLRVAVGDTSVAPQLPGIAPALRTLQAVLQQVTELVADHDLVGLGELYLSGGLDQITSANEDLAEAVKAISPAMLLEVGEKIAVPPVIDNVQHHSPPNLWSGRDYLHWKRTGDFAARLLTDAEHSGDDRFLAYALGWQVAFASLLSGSGFVASIVGSVYRTHWWRTRWIANFVDTWCWGFYQRDPATAADAYGSWPSLCRSGLHRAIEVAEGLDPETVARAVVAEEALPAALPEEFTDYWVGAWKGAYGPGDPTVDGPQALFTADRLQAAYLMTWLVLWFQTSGDMIGCNPVPGAPPAACGSSPTPPNWVDPTVTNPVTGEPFPVEGPHPHLDPDVDEIICGLLLALAGIIATALGATAIGAAAIKKGIEDAIDGIAQLNWDELECQLYWLGVYMFNSLGGLHKMAVHGGFQHPYAGELGALQPTSSEGGVPTAFITTAALNCLSHGLRGPRQPWNGVANWEGQPQEPLEEPVESIWKEEWWPSAIVDDEAVNPVQDSILDPPSSFDPVGLGSFGPGVQSAVLLLSKRPRTLPNWNLDGDRGHGWLTWELQAPYSSPVNAFPES